MSVYDAYDAYDAVVHRAYVHQLKTREPHIVEPLKPSIPTRWCPIVS